MKDLWKQKVQELFHSGAFWNILGSGMMSANTVILTMLVGHFFAIREVGIFGLSLTTAQVLYSLALFGSNDLQMTDYKHRYQFQHYFGVKTLSTLLAFLVCLLVIRLLHFTPAARSYTLLLTGFMLVNSFAELYQSMFFQNYRIDLAGRALFYRYLLSTAAFLMAVLLEKTIDTACIWMLVTDIMATFWWIWKYAKEYRDSSYLLDVSRVFLLVKESLPLCLSVLGSLLVINGPKYLIHLYLPNEIQGIYNILFMPTYAISLLSLFIFKPFLYRYNRILQGREKGFGRLLTEHITVIGVCALFAGVMMRLIGIWVLKVLFGQDLSDYQNLLFFFMLGGGMLAVNQLLYYIMVLLRKQKSIFLNYVFGIAAVVVSGWILVPAFSVNGALLSFVIGQLCLLAGYAWGLAKSLRYFCIGEGQEIAQ